jgi:hypothetical protein
MTQKLKSHELSEEGKRFVSVFGYNEETIDYVEDTKSKTTIVLKNKEKVIFDWDKIHRSAK